MKNLFATAVAVVGLVAIAGSVDVAMAKSMGGMAKKSHSQTSATVAPSFVDGGSVGYTQMLRNAYFGPRGHAGPSR